MSDLLSDLVRVSEHVLSMPSSQIFSVGCLTVLSAACIKAAMQRRKKQTEEKYILQSKRLMVLQ